MTAIETSLDIDGFDYFRAMHLKASDVLGIRTETVTEAFYDGEKWVKFRTARRKEGEEKAIVESGFDFRTATGRMNLSGSGVYYERDHQASPDLEGNGRKPFIIHASKRYSKLNEFLEKLGR